MIKVCDFGEFEENDVKLFSVTNKNNITAKLTNFGAILVSLFVPNKDGNLDDIVLGFDTLEKYFTNDICWDNAVFLDENASGASSIALSSTFHTLGCSMLIM